MPELPEVQATVDHLKERVLNRQVCSTSVSWGRTVHGNSPATFAERLQGRRIVDVFRRGKFVCLRLDGHTPLFLLVHLRMSGSLDVVSSTSPVALHDRVIIELDNKKSIRFNDTRKFGRMYLAHVLEEVTGHLGVEPLSEAFTPTLLIEGMKKRARATKPLLLDQSFIAGLGNIYVDEALWKASINPKAQSDRVPVAKILNLHAAIQSTLTEAISLLGTDFGDNVVHGGMYRPVVYGRENEPCNRCGKAIRRIVVGQRGTHYCPACQRVR